MKSAKIFLIIIVFVLIPVLLNLRSEEPDRSYKEITATEHLSASIKVYPEETIGFFNKNILGVVAGETEWWGNEGILTENQEFISQIVQIEPTVQRLNNEFPFFEKLTYKNKELRDSPAEILEAIAVQKRHKIAYQAL